MMSDRADLYKVVRVDVRKIVAGAMAEGLIQAGWGGGGGGGGSVSLTPPPPTLVQVSSACQGIKIINTCVATYTI